MLRSAKWFLGGGLLIVALVAVLYLEFLGPPNVIWRSEIHEGNRLITDIEAFRRTHGRLPSELSDISSSAAEHERLFYRKCNETHYIVWFGTTLGESMTYDSSSRNWSDLNGVCK